MGQFGGGHGGGGGRGGAGLAETVKSFDRGEFLAARLLGAGDAVGEFDQAAEHVDEQAGERQVGPVGIGGDVEQHDAAGAARGVGDQGRAVGEASPGRLGEVHAGGGEDLAGDADLGGYGEAGEGGGRREGGEAGGLAPGHRATQLAIAFEQFDREQGVRALGGFGAGEADEEAAFVDPVGQQVALWAVGDDAVREDEDGDFARQQGGEFAFAEFGGGLEGAVEIE